MNISIEQLEAIKEYMEDFMNINTSYEEAKEKYNISYTDYLKAIAIKRNKNVTRNSYNQRFKRNNNRYIRN